MLVFRRFRSDNRGAVAIVFALSLVPIVLAAGASVDYSRASSARTSLQAAVDAASLAVALQGQASESDRATEANRVFVAHSPEWLGTLPTPSVNVDDNIVTVSATVDVPTTLMAIAGFDSVAVGVEAKAIMPGGSSPCILILEPRDTGLDLNSDSEVIAPDCDIHINSRSSSAAFANSNSHVDARHICIVGSSRTNSGSSYSPNPETGCDVLDDPLASLPVPSDAYRSCNFSDHNIDSSHATLNPGVYCDDLTINSDSHVTFNPGIYIIRDGHLQFNSHSSGTGDGVFFYFMGEKGRFDFNSDSHVDFSAPTSGTYAGIIFFQSRTSTADYNIINSDSGSVLEGTVYLPNGELFGNSDGALGGASPFTIYVVRKLSLNSASVLTVNSDYAASDVPVPDGLGAASPDEFVRLIE